MKKYAHLVAAPALAAALAFSLAPAAHAAEKTPAQVAGNVQVGAVSPITDPITPESPKWRQKTEGDKRVQHLNVFSPSMNRNIPVALIKADKPGAPTLYLLNGAGGAEQNMDWITSGDNVVDFYHSKGINVVIPMDGAFSYYIDWVGQPTGNKYLDNGPQRWETFLTKELPGPIEAHAQANNNRAIAGMSMSASSAAILAAHNPGFYDAVAGFSGFYNFVDQPAHAVHGLTLQRGNATPDQMLGAPGSPSARHADVVRNAEGLRGTELYFSNGSGLADRTDQAGYYLEQGINPAAATIGSAQLQVEGGVIEAGTNASTHLLDEKLKSLGIPATFNFRNKGTHSWPSWRDDQEKSWPVLERGLFR
ncbi:alpha/beta hydrolase [Corynebacterium tapiri]|uniref:Esterase family protein n=1 Tax=Corynebacterium tapiri TaxID=1448266 RepID=A0A5C4U511_9CORY|nr:alpha/beta hydrolase family protein [Corynebacterium tapiri]TNL97329.1 esterase family protein [Corynebacterium tapiri]